MSKQRMNQLVRLADDALTQQNAHPAVGASAVLNGKTIAESYNGSVAALGVAVAMGELLPTLAIYFQDKSEGSARSKANRRSVLDVVARMITADSDFHGDFSANGNFPENLFRTAMGMDEPGLKKLKKEVIECSIALKHVIRTYQLVQND